MNIHSLIDLGLPEECVPLLEARGFGELTPIQVRAVEAGVLEGRNVLAAAPTSSGKTLVGELVAAVNAGLGMTVYLVSHKALARQVYGIFQTRYLIDGVPFLRAGILTGDEDTVLGEWGSFDVVVSTYERFYASLAMTGRLPANVRAVVVDEVQHLRVAMRGATLELLLASLLRDAKVQVVCLSATVPNSDALARWLEANLARSDSRQPPLEQEIWLPGARRIFRAGMDEPETLPAPPERDVGSIVEFLLREGLGPIAVMATTRPAAEQYAKDIAGKLPVLDPFPETVVRDFRATSEDPQVLGGLDEALGRGVGIHTADLTAEQREIVEEAFAHRELKVIVATPTLVAGVNLPIRTVLYPVLTRFNGTEDAPIDVAEYVNGAGRAGRLGFHDRGTAVLVAESLAQAKRLHRRYILQQDPEPVESQLGAHSNSYLVLHILGMFGAGTAETVAEFAAASLWGFERGYKEDSEKRSELARRLVEIVDRAHDKGWIQSDDGGYRLSAVGRAICASGLEPDAAMESYEALNRHWRETAGAGALGDESLAGLLCSTCELAGMEGSLPHDAHWTRAKGTVVREEIEGYFSGRPGPLHALGAGYLIAQSEVEVLRPELVERLMQDRALRARSSAQASRLLAVAGAIAQCWPGMEEAAFHAMQLSEAVGLQMPMDVVAIARVFAAHRVRGLGRARTIRLARRVGGELGQVLKMEHAQLAAVVGHAQVAGVRGAVLKHFDGLSKQQSARQLKDAADIPHLTGLVEALLREQGMAFEPYVREALNRLGWNLEAVRQAGQVPNPDLRGTTPDGRPVAVECKTPKAYDQEIGKREAMAVLDKVSGESEEVLVTVGRPQFSFAAVQAAHASISTARPVHLITVSAIIEALLTRESRPEVTQRAAECFARLAHIDVQRFRDFLWTVQEA